MRTGERLGERETLRAGESDLALGEGLLSLPLGSGSLSPSTSIASSSFTTSSTTMSAGSGSGDLDIFLHGIQQYANCRSRPVMHQQTDYTEVTWSLACTMPFMPGPNDASGEKSDEGRHHIAKAASGHAHLCFGVSAMPTCLKRYCSLDCWRVKRFVLLPQQPDPLGACMCPPMCGGPPFHQELCMKSAHVQTNAPYYCANVRTESSMKKRGRFRSVLDAQKTVENPIAVSGE